MKILQLLVTFLLFLLIISSKSTAKKYSLLLPVFKDVLRGQYVTQIYQRTPLVPVNLTIDLGGRFLWVDCNNGYHSSAYNHVPCGSTTCKLTGSQGCYGNSCLVPSKPGCNNHTCSHIPHNPINRSSTDGELAQDVIALWSTNYGFKWGNLLSASGVMFGCGKNYLLQGLASGVKGMAGLGKGYTGLPSQLARAFRLPRKFALCLSANTRSNGVIFFGKGSAYASEKLTYTPLLDNPVSTAGVYFPGEPSVEYFIGVKEILINGKKLHIDSKLLSINHTNGVGGTKISTVIPYGTMETSIYKAFKNEFLNAIIDQVPIAKPVRPFELCFHMTTNLIIPQVSLVLMGKNNVTWDLFVDNFMAFPIHTDLLCLGFLDGGQNPQTSIVLGGLQIEENLLEFDLVKKRMGFKSPHLQPTFPCNKFRFTSKH